MAESLSPWKKESLSLQVGDLIVWTGSPRELILENGTVVVYVPTGTKGKVVAVHDGYPPTRLDSSL